MQNTTKFLSALALTFTAIAINPNPIWASDSPFQDYVRYKEIVNGNGDPAELTPYLLPEYRAKFEAASAEQKVKDRETMRSMLNFQGLKLRSQSKDGSNATVIAEGQGMATVGVGAGLKMAMQPLILVFKMTKYGDVWVTTNIDMKRPQEAAAAGISSAQSMDQDRQWCAGAHNVKVPNTPLSGLLQGTSFTLRSAELVSFDSHDSLILYVADSAKFKNIGIFVGLDHKANLDQATVAYTEKSGVQQVQISGKIDGKDSSLFFDKSNGYAISMQRLPLKNGQYPIYLVMRLPDGKHSELKGYLYAKSM